MNSNILVVDGDAFIRGLIRDVLTLRGYRVETASSAAEGVAVLDRMAPVLIFSAVETEDGTAGDLINHAMERGVDALLVLLVEGSNDDVIHLVDEFNAFTYLPKPVERKRLEFVVAQGFKIRDREAEARRRKRELDRVRRCLSAVLGAGDEAMFLLDGQGLVVEANATGLRLLEIGDGEVIGRNYLSLLPEPSVEVQRDVVGRVRDERRPHRVEEHRNGAVLDTLVSPVIQSGRLEGMVVTTSDITAQRRSEVGLAESEKRYRSVYEAARDAIIMFDRNDGSVLDCNAAARRLYGYSMDEMLKLTLADLSDEPERALGALRSGVERVPLAHHRRQSGGSFPAEVSMSHFMHDGREVSTAFVQDISHRKAVEEALREGARLYRAVVEDQTELICRYTPDGLLTFINHAYAKFFGVDEDEVVGSRFFPSLADGERRDLQSWLRDAGPDIPVFDREQHVVQGDGSERWILWTNRAILDHRGELVEIQAVGRDVTERKDAEQALNEATEEKERYRLNLEATFRSIPDAIITVDSDFRVIATNKASGVLFGIDLQQAETQNLDELLPLQGNPCVSVLKQVLKTSKPVRGYEAELDVPSKGVRMVELNCSPLINQDKRHTGAVLVVRDVSRIVDLEKRLHERQGFRGIIGRSSTMQDIYKLLEQLSALEAIVLILGESGTGKELVADALHYGGPRAGNPLIKVNCSALSESLLESELFGHVRGAFTGAVRDKVGRIQAAEGGTLFLDEIGDISPLIQLKLLRFLEQKEYERVGESRTCTADVRIIAATNVNLLEAVRKGAFREDLYYRLNVMPVRLPPLRERQGDIPLLVGYFLETFSGQFNKTFSHVSEEVMDLFMGYAWPGNIRELRHLLEHACILSPGGEINLKHLRGDLVDQMRASSFAPNTVPAGTMPTPPFMPASMPPTSRKAGREEILEALERCAGNKARAARQLGIHRATLYRKLKAWGLD